MHKGIKSLVILIILIIICIIIVEKLLTHYTCSCIGISVYLQSMVSSTCCILHVMDFLVSRAEGYIHITLKLNIP